MHFNEFINSEIVLFKKYQSIWISEYFSTNGFQVLKLLDKWVLTIKMW